jgi:hypothetical protein
VPFLHTDDVPRHKPPGHVRGCSKYLVQPERTGGRSSDLPLSSHPPGGSVERHNHALDEHGHRQVEGTGDSECGNETQRVGPRGGICVPSRAPQAQAGSGNGDPVLLVVTFPPSDIAR